MAKSWKNAYQKKHNIEYLEHKEKEEIKELENKRYTNFGVKELGKDIYYNATYYIDGLFTNLDGSKMQLCECYKDGEKIFVILGTKNPLEKYTYINIPYGKYYLVDYEIKAEIPFLDDIENMPLFLLLNLKDETKNLDRKLEIIMQEIFESSSKLIRKI